MIRRRDFLKYMGGAAAGSVVLASCGGSGSRGTEPAVPIRRSITPDYLVCLEDGRKFKSLKRHLRERRDSLETGKHAEMADVMGLFAPRPLVIVAGRTDSIFPIRGVREAFRHLQAIYRAAGAADRCHLVVGPEGHRFYAKAAWRKMLPELARAAARA